MALQQWALPHLRALLPLDDSELQQLVAYTDNLSDTEAAKHLESLLGSSQEAREFISSFVERREEQKSTAADENRGKNGLYSSDQTNQANSTSLISDKSAQQLHDSDETHPPAYTTIYNAQPVAAHAANRINHHHSNAVIEASRQRAIDEQEMQQAFQNLQYQYNIFNSDIEPEHEIDAPCNCAIHQYQQRKYLRLPVQEVWARAVMYPGERYYRDNPYSSALFSSNPYRLTVMSPYGRWQRQASLYSPQRPIPRYYTQCVRETIALNNRLNHEAQSKIDALEPKTSIWVEFDAVSAMAGMSISDEKQHMGDKTTTNEPMGSKDKSSSKRLSTIRKAMGIKSNDEKADAQAKNLRISILSEERGRWPDQQWRQIVANYQEKIGIANKVADLRARHPIQYLHLLRGGYFEPIPVAWATQISNPMKFGIEASGGWRGITPAWRGYEDLAEERLYWVLNHREGDGGMRMKPDFISEMNMALARMARAVEPPPLYFAVDDTCHLQHTSEGYSKQVMPSPFRPFGRPEVPTDDTMILLDVSGSMDFIPVRPVYDEYLVTRFERSTQPKNKDVAQAIIRRFIDAMANHDHQQQGYDMVTFSNSANHIGRVNHSNFKRMWRNVHIGGGTRVMTGWQKVKDLHFQKHSESATYHPVYGWQAGPQTPMLRLLLLLDGEATDMDEFEMDILGLSWASVTIFLVGTENCPHHHRHANELDRISQANHHVSFVDAQGNCPERYVTHELLKRHLGYNISMPEFEAMETPPPYDG